MRKGTDMANRAMWAVWALVPLGALAFHLGPGQKLVSVDRAGQHLRLAASAEEAGNWATAAEEYGAAAAALPEGRSAERGVLNLKQARARVYSGDLIGGTEQLDAMVAEAGESADKDLVREARYALGEAQYFTAWLMRLDGAGADEWKPEAEKARQQFRLLAETAEANGQGPDAESFKKNLEAVVRFEHLDLSDLKALPLPKKCCANCNGLCQRKREQRLSKCQNPGNKDVRQQIKSDSAGEAVKREKGS